MTSQSRAPAAGGWRASFGTDLELEVVAAELVAEVGPGALQEAGGPQDVTGADQTREERLKQRETQMLQRGMTQTRVVLPQFCSRVSTFGVNFARNSPICEKPIDEQTSALLPFLRCAGDLFT